MNGHSKNVTLELPRPLVNQILAHAQQNPDEEICGLISSKSPDEESHGSKNTDKEYLPAANYYRIANVAEDKTRHFEMSGSQQIAAMKRMREQGEKLMAIVHSHPDAPAIPSALDKSSNNYPELYYLVVSLDTKGVLQLRGYKQVAGEFEPTELILEHH